MSGLADGLADSRLPNFFSLLLVATEMRETLT